MPIPTSYAPVPFDIAPALSQYQTGIQTRVGLQDRQREWEGQAEEAIMRAADLADTPEKWERFVTQIGSRFEGADLSQVTWENRDYYLSGNPQYRAQQERNRAAGAAASASAAAAATRQRRLSELVGGSAPAAGGVPAGAGGIPTLGTPRAGPAALSALGGVTAPAQQVSAEEGYIPGMETPTPPPPAPLATGAAMPMLGTPTAAPTFNAQQTSYLASIGASQAQIASLSRMIETGDPRQLAIAEEAISALQRQSVAGPAAPDYGFTEVGNTLVRTDANAGTATPVYAPGAETGERPMTAERRAFWGIPADDDRVWIEDANGTNPRVVGGAGQTINVGNPTADTRRYELLYRNAAAELPIVEGAFNELARLSNQLGGLVGALGNFAVSPEYQVGLDAVTQIVQMQTYALTGAAATESEAQRIARTMLPGIGDEAPRVAEKLARIRRAVENLRMYATLGGPPQDALGAAPPPGGGNTTGEGQLGFGP